MPSKKSPKRTSPSGPGPSASGTGPVRTRSKTSTSAAQPAPPTRQAAQDDEETVADEVFDFVRAIDHYKRTNGRPFPTWSEVLEVLKGLGYERRAGDGANASTSSAGDATQQS